MSTSAADGGQEHGVGGATGLEHLVPERRPVGVDRRAADEPLVEFELADSLEQLTCRGHVISGPIRRRAKDDALRHGGGSRYSAGDVANNVELVRRVYEGWARGDFSEIDALPEIEFEMVDWPHQTKVSGIEAMSRTWRATLSAWDDFRAIPLEYVDCGGNVSREPHRGRRQGRSGAVVSADTATVWTVEDGLVRPDGALLGRRLGPAKPPRGRPRPSPWWYRVCDRTPVVVGQRAARALIARVRHTGPSCSRDRAGDVGVLV